MQQNVWLALSLFCSKNNWSFIFNEGIISFLSNQSREDNNIPFLIEFNNSAGENIRFSILTARENAENLACRADKHFKDLFSKCTKMHEEDILPSEVNHLFMPLPENTVHYGLYEPVKSNETDTVNSLRRTLSAVIVDALKEEKNITNSDIDTLAFYLNMTLLNIIGEAGAPVHELSDFYKNKAGEIPNDLIHSEFKKNRESLFEIANSMIYSKDYGTDSRWLLSWQSGIKEMIRQASGNDTINDIHKQIVSLLCRHLDISGQRRIRLSYFIHQLLLTDLMNKIFKIPIN